MVVSEEYMNELLKYDFTSTKKAELLVQFFYTRRRIISLLELI